jgi:hypothetical protein
MIPYDILRLFGHGSMVAQACERLRPIHVDQDANCRPNGIRYRAATERERFL